MQPVGIEPTSTALQTAAMTTSAKPALGCLTSIDLVLPVSQTSVQATTLKTPLLAPLPRVERELKLSQSFVISLSPQRYLFLIHLYAF